MNSVLEQARPVDLHQRSTRGRLAKMVTKLFDHWELPGPDQATLLGLSPESRATIARYRQGDQHGEVAIAGFR